MALNAGGEFCVFPCVYLYCVCLLASAKSAINQPGWAGFLHLWRLLMDEVGMDGHVGGMWEYARIKFACERLL